MHFDEGDPYRGKRIAKRDAGVGQSPGVDDDPRNTLAFRSLYALDQSPLMIALKDLQRRPLAPGHAAQPLVDALEVFSPVNPPLTCTQQVEVRSVKNQNVFGPSPWCARRSLEFRHGWKFDAVSCKLSSICHIFQQNERLSCSGVQSFWKIATNACVKRLFPRHKSPDSKWSTVLGCTFDEDRPCSAPFNVGCG